NRCNHRRSQPSGQQGVSGHNGEVNAQLPANLPQRELRSRDGSQDRRTGSRYVRLQRALDWSSARPYPSVAALTRSGARTKGRPVTVNLEKERLHADEKEEAKKIAYELTVDEEQSLRLPWGGRFVEKKQVFPADKVGSA